MRCIRAASVMELDVETLSRRLFTDRALLLMQSEAGGKRNGQSTSNDQEPATKEYRAERLGLNDFAKGRA